ncbi:MAG: hypothetical protein IPP44_18955 [Ideonella sp.]|nr:hypothetical protein [Ideonella sp.]
MLNALDFGRHTFPHGQALKNAVVDVQDLRAWLQDTRRMSVLVAEPDADPVEPVAPPDTRKRSGDDEWVTLAREEARKIIAREAGADRFPPQRRIAEEIAADFRTRKPPVHGTDGKPLAGETIKRHALKGISSATKKARSTAIGRSK